MGSKEGVHGEWGVPSFQDQQTVSMDWTPQEQILLEDGLAKYASESKIIRYAKIAVQLKNKTVRDVALRCRWMSKKDISRRRKDNFNARKTKDIKEKLSDSSPKLSRLSIQSALPQTPGIICNGDDNSIAYNADIGGATRQLLEHNTWAFKQISANIATHHVDENIGLLSQARDNIFKILTNLNEMGTVMKKLPPLPKVNQELANTVLPPSNLSHTQTQSFITH